jgi:ATP synthase I chain
MNATSLRVDIDPIERWNLGISAGAIAASLALAPATFTAGLAVGAALEAANFRVLRRATQRMFGGELRGGRAWTGGFALRFVLLGAALYAAVHAGAHPVGLALGLSTIVPAVVLYAWRNRPASDPAAAQTVAPPDDPSWDDWNPWLARERRPVEPGEEDEG